MVYIYFAKEKATGKWGFFRNLDSLTNYFTRLSKKKSTIGNRFREKMKKNEPQVIYEWGFQIYQTKRLIK